MRVQIRLAGSEPVFTRCKDSGVHFNCDELPFPTKYRNTTCIKVFLFIVAAGEDFRPRCTNALQT